MPAFKSDFKPVPKLGSRREQRDSAPWGRRREEGSAFLPESTTPAPTPPRVARPPLPRPPAPSHPGRARRVPPKVSEGAESCGLAGAYLVRRARAAAPGRAGAPGAAACLPAGCPLHPVVASCARPAGLGRTLARRTVPRAAAACYCPLLAGRGATLSSRGLPGPAPRPGSLLRCAPARAPRPAPRGPRPCAPSHGQGTSEALGRRALRPRPAGPAPGSRPRRCLRSLRTPRPLAGRAPPRAWTGPAPALAGARFPSRGLRGWGPWRYGTPSAPGPRDYFSVESFRRPKVWCEAAEGSGSGCRRARRQLATICISIAEEARAEQGKGSPGQAMPGEELGWGRWRGAADAQSGGLWDGGSA